MVTLRRYLNVWEAERDKSLLEAASIPTFLSGENSASAGYGTVLGELRLEVEEADVDRARRVLDEHKEFAPLPDDFIPPENQPEANPRLENTETNAKMENNINQEILEELRKLRKMSQWTSIIAVLGLVAVCVWLFVRVPPRQANPWSDISAAIHRYDYQTALKLTQELAAAHTDDYYPHYYLGYIYFTMGDLARAEAEYSRAYELWPSEEMQKKVEAVRKRRESEASKTK